MSTDIIIFHALYPEINLLQSDTVPLSVNNILFETNYSNYTIVPKYFETIKLRLATAYYCSYTQN